MTDAIGTTVDLLPSLAELTGSTVPSDRVIGTEGYPFACGQRHSVPAREWVIEKGTIL